MNRDTATLAVIAGIVGIALGAALFFVALGGVGVTRTTSSAGPVRAIPMPPADGSTGAIFDLRKTGGHSFFGITFTASTYAAHIGIAVPDGCLIAGESGQVELSSDAGCASLPVHGELVGSGSLAPGARLAVVRVEVSKDCYETLAVGDEWPSASETCNRGE